MSSFQQASLSRRLLYLPLDLHEKVLLWLTYKGLKPVSEITAEKRNKVHLRRMMRDVEYKKTHKSSYDFNSKNSKRIRKWLKDAELNLATEPSHESAWHIGKNADQVKTSVQIFHNFDLKKEIETGILFGFPEESAKAYAHNRNKDFEETLKVMVGTGDLRFKNEYLKDKYFTPYIFYNMPKDKVQEESKIPKIWADTIRRDIPKLALWFEKKYSGTIRIN